MGGGFIKLTQMHGGGLIWVNPAAVAEFYAYRDLGKVIGTRIELISGDADTVVSEMPEEVAEKIGNV